MSKFQKSNRRCFYFDDAGWKIGDGCPRPYFKCSFVHPEEREWDDAELPTYGPVASTFKRHKRGDSPPSPSSHRWRDRGRDREDDDRRLSYNSRSRSRTRSPPRRRQVSIGSSVGVGRSSPQQPTSSINIDKTSDMQTQSASTKTPAGSLPTPPSTSIMPASRIPGLIPTPPTGPKAFRNEPTQPTMLPPPPPPPGPAPLPPPQPLPEVPDSLTLQMAPDIPTLDLDAKRTLWEERMKLLTTCVQTHDRITTLGEEYKVALTVVQGRFFSMLPETDKTRINAQLDTLVKQREEAQTMYDQAQQALLSADSWPTAPSTASSVAVGSEEDLQAKHEEIVKYIHELHTTATEIQKILGDITTSQAPPAPPLFLPSDSEEEMDVDVDPDNLQTNRGRKRRRLVKDGLADTDTPTQQELEIQFDRLQGLETRASTLQNAIDQHDRDKEEQITAVVEARFEELQLAQTERRRAQDKKRKDDAKERDRKIEAARKEVDLTGGQVGELAGEITELLTRSEKLDAELAAQTKERDERFTKVLEVEERLNTFKRTQEANTQKIKTLEAALKAYTSRLPSPPASPKTPSLAYILHTLEEHLIDVVRTTVQPLAEELRRDVEHIVKAKNKELYGSVWTPIEQTLKVLDLIKIKLDAGMALSGGSASTSVAHQ